MSHPIKFTRKIQIESYIFEGTVSKTIPREDMTLVMKFLKEFPGSSETDFAKHLFDEASTRKVVARKLLASSEFLRLSKQTKERYSLTDEGEQALVDGEVFIPEEGVYHIVLTRDPLLYSSIISIELDGFKPQKGNPKKQNAHTSSIAIPRSLKELEGSTEEILKDHKLVKIEHLKDWVELSDKGKELLLSWTPSISTIEIFKERALVIKTQSQETIDEKDIKRVLLHNADLLDQWDEKNNTLALDFDALTPADKKNMTKDIKVNNPEVTWDSEYLGSFDTVTIQKLPIKPKHKEDAERWALWRLDSLCTSIVTKSKFEQWKGEAIQPLEEWDIQLPSLREFAHQAWKIKNQSQSKNRNTWNLISAADWSL